jgi:hypothetical protein
MSAQAIGQPAIWADSLVDHSAMLTVEGSKQTATIPGHGDLTGWNCRAIEMIGRLIETGPGSAPERMVDGSRIHNVLEAKSHESSNQQVPDRMLAPIMGPQHAF